MNSKNYINVAVWGSMCGLIGLLISLANDFYVGTFLSAGIIFIAITILLMTDESDQQEEE